MAEREARVRTLVYTRTFGLPPQETLLMDVSCAVTRAIPMQGRLYISRHFVCFFCGVGDHIKIIIPVCDILDVQRSRSFVLQSTLLISTKNEGSIQFTILRRRGKCYELIRELMDNESSFDSSEKDSAVAPDELITLSNAKPLLDAVKPERTTSVSRRMSGVDTRVEEEEQSRHVDESFFRTPPTSMEWKSIARFDMPVSVSGFERRFLADTAEFSFSDLQQEIGSTEILITEWIPHNVENSSVRDLTFRVKIPNPPPFVAKSTRVHTQEYYRRGEDQIVLMKWIESLDVPYGDSFYVWEQWTVQHVSDEMCTIDVRCAVEFTKSVIWKSFIIKEAFRKTKETAVIWEQVACDLLSGKKHEIRTVPDDDATWGFGSTIMQPLLSAISTTSSLVQFAAIVTCCVLVVSLFTRLFSGNDPSSLPSKADLTWRALYLDQVYQHSHIPSAWSDFWSIVARVPVCPGDECSATLEMTESLRQDIQQFVSSLGEHV